MPDFSDDDLRAALDALSTEPSAERLAVRQRARELRRGRVLRVGAGVAALALAVAGVVVIAQDDEREIPIVSGSTSPEGPTTSSTVTTDPRGDSPEPWIQIWPDVIPAGKPTTITAVMMNPAANDKLVFTGCAGGPLELIGNRTLFVDPDHLASVDCAADVDPVFPGNFSHEFEHNVPPLESGIYDLLGARLVVADEPPGPADIVETREEYLRFAGADLLSDPQVTIPDEIVILSGNRLALHWTSACNRPAYDLRFRYESGADDGTVERVLVELRTALFLVTDCVGEPSNWATVVDLPAPLRGASVLGTVFDPGPGVSVVGVAARRVDAVLRGELGPALVSMDREPLSYLDPSTAACPPNAGCAIGTPETVWISLRPFDGCGAWIALPITDFATNTLYVQAYVPADNERCEGDWPPEVGFSTTDPPDYLFGHIVRVAR